MPLLPLFHLLHIDNGGFGSGIGFGGWTNG